MAALAHSFSETTTISSLIGTTYTTVHTHASSNFVAGDVYLISVKLKLFGELVTGLVQCKVRHGSTDFADSEALLIPATASGGADFPHPYHWFEKWTAVSSEDITVQIRGSGATGEAQVDQVEFVAVRLDDLTVNTDYWYSDVATDTALSVAGIDGASISLTPPASTDLWVMAFGRVDIGSITTSAGSRIVSTGTFNESRPSNAKEGDDSTNEIWLCTNERVYIGLANSAQTFTEQSYVESGPTGNVLHSRMFALRLNVFRNRKVAWTAGAEVLQSATPWADPFQTGQTLTPDVTGDSWISVNGIFDSGAALREILHRLQMDNADQPPTQTADTYDEAWALDADNEIPFGTQTVEALTASTTYTFDWEGHTNTTAGAPQVIDRSFCAFTFELASNDITSSGALSVPIPGVAASALLTFAATAALAVAQPAVAATAAETFTSTAALTVPAPSVVASSALTFTATGALLVPMPSVAGTADIAGVPITSDGALSVPAPSVAGSALETFEGSGALTVSAPAVAGTASETFTGTAALSVAQPSVAGSALESFTGSGALTVTAPSTAGSAEITGEVGEPAPVLLGIGGGFAGGGTGAPASKAQRAIERKVDKLVDALLAEPEIQAPAEEVVQPAAPATPRAPIPLPGPIRAPAPLVFPTVEIAESRPLNLTKATEDAEDSINRVLLAAVAAMQ